MPQGKDYIFCLQDKNFNFYKFENGLITLSARPYFMQFAPDGWNDIAIQNIRNKVYKAIDRTVSVPLGYIMDGAQILKYVAYDKGLKEEVYLTIAAQQLNYTPAPAGTLVFTAGQSPFTPNGLATGTITGTPGETVYIKINLTNGGTSDSVAGFFDTLNFSFDYTNPDPTYSVVIPITGIIDFNVLFTQVGGSSTASMQIVGSAGQTVGSYGYWYKRVYRGEVDWSTFDHTGPKVTCTTLEDGLPKYLKANDKTVYEFLMNVPEAIYWDADGIKLHEKANYQDTDGVEFSQEFLLSDRGLTPTTFLGSEGDNSGIILQTQNIASYASFAALIAQDNCMMQNLNTYPVTIIITGKIQFRCIRQSGTWSIRFRYLTSSSTIPTQNDHEAWTGSGVLVPGQTYTHDYSLSITLNPNDRLYFEGIYLGGISGDPCIEFTSNSKASIVFITRKPSSYLRAFRPQYLFEQLINKITEGNYTAAVTAFFEANKTKVLTCGNAIRGLDDAVMKISFEDFFKFWDSIYSVGIIDRGTTVDFAEEGDLVDFADVIDLNEPDINTFKVSVAKDLLINEVSFGFPDIRNDIGVLNGNEEFNSNSLFSIDSTVLTGKLDKISPIKASCYEIEKICITTFQKDTTDYKNDNDNYAVHIEDTLQPASGSIPAHYKIDRSLNALVTAGLIEPDTIFNLWFSPKRSFIRNGLHVHGRFYKADTGVFYFRSANKNSKLVCDGVTEAADVNIGSLTAQIATPWIIDLETSPPDELISLLDLNPLQALRFPFQGNTYLILLEKISIASSSKKSQQIQGRSAASNNLTKLINYSG